MAPFTRSSALVPMRANSIDRYDLRSRVIRGRSFRSSLHQRAPSQSERAFQQR